MFKGPSKSESVKHGSISTSLSRTWEKAANATASASRQAAKQAANAAATVAQRTNTTSISKPTESQPVDDS